MDTGNAADCGGVELVVATTTTCTCGPLQGCRGPVKVKVVEFPVVGLTEAPAGGLPMPVALCRLQVTLSFTARLMLAVPAWLSSRVGLVVGEVNCRVEFCPPPPLPLLLLLEELEQPNAMPQTNAHSERRTTRLLVTTLFPSGDSAPHRPEIWLHTLSTKPQRKKLRNSGLLLLFLLIFTSYLPLQASRFPYPPARVSRQLFCRILATCL